MVDVTEILTHWHAGRSISEVARSLGVDRNTVRKYVAPAIAAGITPGGDAAPISPKQWGELVRGWFPELVTTQLRHPKFAEIAPFHELIRQQLEVNTATTIWQRLCDEHGLRVSIASFRRYLAATMPDRSDLRGQVTVRKPDPPPGEEAQLDYGYLGAWTDPASGKRRRVWAFVMVLSTSRHLFVRPVLAMPLGVWVEAHVAALGFFGGAPRRLVTDNLKASVISPDLYDPKLNRTYAELAGYYGMLIDPARARKPKDKPRVERPIPYVRDSFFAGRDFRSLPAMRAAAAAWCVQVAGRRACRPLGGAAPLAIFAATEQPALLPLPPEPFELAAWSTPKVHPDCHVQVAGALYSVPWRLVGTRVDVRATTRLVEVFAAGELVKTHPRAQRGHRRTDWADYPPEKVAFLQRTPAWCRRTAATAGPNIAALVEGLLADGALHHLRAAQGVLGLAGHYGTARLDAACQQARAVGDPSYRTVKGILAIGAEQQPLPSRVPAADVPALLRGAAALTSGLPDPAADHHDHHQAEVLR